MYTKNKNVSENFTRTLQGKLLPARMLALTLLVLTIDFVFYAFLKSFLNSFDGITIKGRLF